MFKMEILQISLEKRLWACFARAKFFLHFMTTRRFLFSISLMVKHVSVSRGVRPAMPTHLFNDSRRPLPAGYVPLSLVLPSQNIAHSIVTHALAIPRSYILFTLQCMACGWGKSSSSYRTGYVCSCVPGDHFPCQPGQSQSVRLSELTKINIQSSSQQPENIDMWIDGPGQSSVRVIFFSLPFCLPLYRAHQYASTMQKVRSRSTLHGKC